MVEQDILQELSDDPELFFSIAERGAYHADVSHAAGERAVASRNRIGGLNSMKLVVGRLPEALRAGGWDGSAPVAFSTSDPSHENGGREWALRGAIADAVVRVPADRPDPKAADTVADLGQIPDGAVSFEGGDALVVRLRYLSDGHAANGERELRDALTGLGFQEA